MNQTAEWLRVLGLDFFLSFVQACLPEFVNGIPKTRGCERSLTAVDGAKSHFCERALLLQADRLGAADLE